MNKSIPSQCISLYHFYSLLFPIQCLNFTPNIHLITLISARCNAVHFLVSLTTSHSIQLCTHASQTDNVQEPQLKLTNPHNAFRGQSRSPNIVPFHMLGIVSYYCTIVTLFLRHAVFLIIDFKQDHSWPWHQGERSIKVNESGTMR